MKGDKCNLGCRYNFKGVCHITSHPKVSCGKQKVKSVVSKKTERNDKSLSEQQIKAYNYNVKGKSLLWIAKKLKSTKSTIYRWVKKVEGVYKEDKGVSKWNDKGSCKKRNDLPSRKFVKRLHNDVVSFLIDPVDLSMVKNRVKLKYSCYVLDKRDKNFHIQIWSNKIVVRFLKDVEGVDIRDVKKKADERIKYFLDNYYYKGINFLDDKFEQVSRHYALLGTGLAKRVVREGRKLFIFDSERRLRGWVDNSHSNPELEFDKDFGFDDSINTEAYMGELLEKVGYYDLPTVTKTKIDIIIGVQKDYAKNIKLHLEVERNKLKVEKETLKTLKAIQKSLKK